MDSSEREIEKLANKRETESQLRTSTFGQHFLIQQATEREEEERVQQLEDIYPIAVLESRKQKGYLGPKAKEGRAELKRKVKAHSSNVKD